MLPRDLPRRRTELTSHQALEKLATTGLGRVSYTRQALPVISPASHLIDDGHLILRSHDDSTITPPAAVLGEAAIVLAYQADTIDPATVTGWSVTVTGLATVVTDPQRTARYLAALSPWVQGETSQIIAFKPELITGFELTGSQQP